LEVIKMNKMKNIKFFFSIIAAALSVFLVSCTKTTYDFGSLVAPSNLELTANIAGADASNPFGDGSGTVVFSAKADNAITYKYIYNNEDVMAPSGEHTYNFSKTGTFKYTVTVVAIGTAGITSSKSMEVEVKATYVIPADMLTMLTSDSARTWRIENETAGHMGVGPADSATPIWWAAAPNDKAATGMYDDTYTFDVSGSFVHTTQGSVFGQSGPLTQDYGSDKGQTANSNNEFEYYPLDAYTETWTISAPGGVETLTISNNGFLGFYVGGSHSYTILSRSANQMQLRTVGADGNGWFFILTAN